MTTLIALRVDRGLLARCGGAQSDQGTVQSNQSGRPTSEQQASAETAAADLERRPRALRRSTSQRTCGAAGERAQALRRVDRGGEGLRRAVPPPGLGWQRSRCCSTCGRAAQRARQGSSVRAAPRAPLLPAQQGAVVAPRRERAVHSRCAAEAGAGQLLSGGRDKGGGRGVAEDAARRRARARDGILHDDSPRSRRQLHGRAVQRRVPGRGRRMSPRSCARRRR